MSTANFLLEFLGRVILANVEEGLVPSVEMRPDMVEEVWQEWSRLANAEQRREEIQTLTQISPPDLAKVLDQLVMQLASDQPFDVQDFLKNYLIQIPSALHRRFRRPADSSGRSVPHYFRLQEAQDLGALLPRETAWFLPGDRPGEIGDCELKELMEITSLGEAWQAHNPHLLEVPPVWLQFFLHPALQHHLLQPDNSDTDAILERLISEVHHPGILQLRRLHLHANPPGLEYEFPEGGELTNLIHDWHAEGKPSAENVTGVVLQLAQTLGFLHQLPQPMVHRRLKPSTIWVQQTQQGDLRCKITEVAFSELFPRSLLQERAPVQNSSGVISSEPDPRFYTSPEELRGDLPHPRDDVYSLGVLWYQMLTGKLYIGWPGGSRWRKQLAEDGISGDLIELLEMCFEDEASYRPQDGNDLARRLHAVISAGQKSIHSVAGKVHEAQAGPASSETPTTQEFAQPTHDRISPPTEIPGNWDRRPQEPLELTNNLGMKFVLIPAGTFEMGAPQTEDCIRDNECPPHEVTLTRAFYLSIHPVTQGQYAKLMGRNPAKFSPKQGGSLGHPVENVTWEDAIAFCRTLSGLQEERQAQRVYRLPTEAEWEYACRGGTQTYFCFGDSLSPTQANFDGQFPFGNHPAARGLKKTTPVGSFPPNPFGLYDIHGNVWEWCADWLSGLYYQISPQRDPRGPSQGKYRVVRGGSWRNQAITCRSSYRNGLAPQLKDSATGFRVVLESQGGF